MTPKGSTHVDMFTGTTSSFSLTASGQGSTGWGSMVARTPVVVKSLLVRLGPAGWVLGGVELGAAEVAPILRDRGLFRREYTGRTLREHYGLHRPANGFAAAAGRSQADNSAPQREASFVSER